jgi:hypothetical protein
MWAAGDDSWEPEFVRTLVDELEREHEAGVCLCAVRREYPDGRPKDVIRYSGENTPNQLSSFRLAANLLSPKKEKKHLKFNLFICGLFRHEAVKKVMDLGDEILGYGERAFLAPIALSYKFRYVDQELFTKTVYEKSYKDRSTDDDYVKSKKTIKYWQHYLKILNYVVASPSISVYRKLFALAIICYLTQRFVQKLKKRFGDVADAKEPGSFY